MQQHPVITGLKNGTYKERGVQVNTIAVGEDVCWAGGV